MSFGKIGNKFIRTGWNLAVFGLFSMLIFGTYGLYKLYDYAFNDIVVKSDVKVVPKVIIVTKDNVSDTLYIYTFKK